GQQPIPVGAEAGMVPNWIVDPQPDEPSEQKVKLHALHQLALGAYPVKCLQEHRPQEPFRWNRRPTKPPRIKLLKVLVQSGQCLIGNVTNPPKRMIWTDANFNVDVGKKRSRVFIRPAHPALPSSGRVNHNQGAAATDFFNSLLNQSRRISSTIRNASRGEVTRLYSCLTRRKS